MMEFIRNFFNKSGEPLVREKYENSSATFVLSINELEIGILRFEDGFWIFEYSEVFKNQSEYKRLVGFPKLEKIYKSDTLWPFFKIRIPGLKQPMVRDILEAENIKTNDEASLLRYFGRINTSNPYILHAL